MKYAFFVLLLALIPGLSGHGAQAQTLKAVRDRGFLSCGVSKALPGISFEDDKGNWTGLGVDVCRAIAAAVLSDPTKVLFLPLSAKERFAALQSGEIDLLSQNSIGSLTRDAGPGLNDAGVTYYDGQGFLVRKSSKIHSPLEFDTASICVQAGTANERNVTDYFNANDLRYEIIPFATADEALKAYGKGSCDTYTSEVSQLNSDWLKLADPSEHIVLQRIISKEPLGPAVRRGDDQWRDIVKWTLVVMMDAEELGVTQKNINEIAKLDHPELRRVFGSDVNLGKRLGLTKDWVIRIVEAVGNYGEAFDRNLGAYSELGIARGPNRLWTRGGLQYAPSNR